MTADEVIATLRHGSFPYLLIEGSTEMQLYRFLLARLPNLNVQLQICQGRDTLLEVYRRRAELGGVPVVFLADKDMWIFDEDARKPYAEVVWTAGYCIENDILLGHVVHDKLLSQTEKGDFDAALATLCEWFAFEVDEFLQGRDAHTGCHVGRVLVDSGTEMCPQWIAARGVRDPTQERLAQIKADPWRLVRGKQLVQLLARFLDKVGRHARYNGRAVLDICITHGEGQLENIAAGIEDGFAKQGVSLQAAVGAAS